jgi:SAM-dependent methyltransferase
MEMHKLFTVYGNCQAGPLAGQLLDHPEFASQFSYVPLEPCFSISEERVTAWVGENKGKLDLLIAQDLQPGWRDRNPAWDIETISSCLAPGGTLLRYSDMYFRGVNPLLVYPKSFPRAKEFDYIDLISLTVAASGHSDVGLSVALFNSASLLRAHELAAIRAVARADLALREKSLDIKTAGVIADLCERSPAFHAFNHPANAALEVVARSIVRRLGLPASTPKENRPERLAAVQIPLPACIRQAYSGSARGPDRFRIESGQEFDAPSYFKSSLARLQSKPVRQLAEELELHRKETISGLVIGSIERELADMQSLSPLTVGRVRELSSRGTSPDFVLSKVDTQAVGFMVDILSNLRPVLIPAYAGQTLSVLDLGAKTGAGSQLLGYLGQGGSFSKVKFAVTCADIDPAFQAYARARHPNIEYLNADPVKGDRRWDVVICSHVVEHTPDPLAFVREVARIANKYVVVAFPYSEDPARLIPGHLHSLGHDFLRSLKPLRYEVYDGLFWSQSLCCVAVIDAKACAEVSGLSVAARNQPAATNKW